ncbi:MAG: MoaD/ThiS family protein [Fimbriimonadaceae bacterium]|nr:MoaD/ThiS family protein [Fimbriimonadaceae bacterium]
MTVTVRVYAQLRELVPGGQRQTTCALPSGATVLELADRLGIGDQPLEVMVNDQRAHHGIRPADGDVVSFFPALAGG